MRGPHLRRQPNGARAAVGLGTIVGTLVIGLGLAADVSAGTTPGIALSSSTSSPGAIFNAIVYRCNAGDDIGFVVQGVSYTETCLLDGVALLEVAASTEPGSYQVVATTSSGQLTADYSVAAPGQPSLNASATFLPGEEIDFALAGCTPGSQAVAAVDGQQLTSECESGVLGSSAEFSYLADENTSGIFPLTVTLVRPAAVLQGTIYIKDLGAVEEPGPVTTLDPGLAGTGPGGSSLAQLVAAAGSVGLGVACVAWARRRRATT